MDKVCKLCNGFKTVYDEDGGEINCPCFENGHVEIIGHDGEVHYRRPCWHKTVEEAAKAGYSFRSWKNHPDV